MKTLFFNGKVYTLDEKVNQIDAFYVQDGIIQKTGTLSEFSQLQENPEINKIDLQNRVVIPGFNDAHIHIWKVGDLKLFTADLRGVTSIQEIREKLLDFSNKNPHLKWILARGFNESFLKEKRMPTREDLDIAFPNKPVYLIRTCAHIAVVNSKAIEIANITPKTPVPYGGEIKLDKNGQLNGVFTETAKGLLTPFLPTYSPELYEQMILAAGQELLSWGITSATDPAVMPDLLEVYIQLEKQKKLPLRINAMPIGIPDGETKALPLPKQYKSDFLNIDTIKFFADGGLSGQTASLYNSYKGFSNQFGVLRLNYDFFYPIALKARQNNWKIATHAIGDKAIDEVIKVYESIQNEIQIEGKNRIEHLGIAHTQQMNKLKELKIAVVTQPIFLKELGKNFIDSLDETCLKRCYAFKSMFNADLNVAFSTDAPVVKNINPFLGIQAAFDRKNLLGNIINGDESVDIRTAIKAYTIGGAIAQQEEQQKGTISDGKYADFIVLNQDVFEPKIDIASTQVLATYINGMCVFKKK